MRVVDHLRPPFAVLAGAGISYAPPSSLPRAMDFITSILDQLPLAAEDREELAAATSWAWPAGIGYEHLLRFEQLVESLELTVDPELACLMAALPSTSPNDYHYALAVLLSKGFPVLTTNFDTLIEEACMKLHVPCTVVASEDDYDLYLRDGPHAFPNPLFKLHGTVRLATSVGAHGLNTCISDVTTQTVTAPRKWQTVEKLLERHDLLVLGYSGSDDYDVMPSIKFAPGQRRLWWVVHRNDPPDRVFRGLHGPDAILRIQDRKLAWFFNRMFLSFDYQFGSISRRPEDAIVLEGDTAALLKGAMTDLGFHIPATSEACGVPRLDSRAITSLFERAGDAAILLSGRLEQTIGRYHKALAYLHRFLQAAAHRVPILEARAHLWIAQILHEQAREHAALGHFRRAFTLFRGGGRLHWSDLSTLQQLVAYAQNEKWIVSGFLAMHAYRGFDEKTDSREKPFGSWQQGREIVFNIQMALATNNVDRARESLDVLHDCDPSLDTELHADVLYWRAVLRSLDDPIRGLDGQIRCSDGYDDSANLARRASGLYGNLQLRSKMIDALILAAEQDLPTWPDTGYEEASLAAEICQFIGNDASAVFAYSLQADFAEILARLGESELDGVPVGVPEELRSLAEECKQRHEATEGKVCCRIPYFSFQA